MGMALSNIIQTAVSVLKEPLLGLVRLSLISLELAELTGMHCENG